MIDIQHLNCHQFPQENLQTFLRPGCRLSLCKEQFLYLRRFQNTSITLCQFHTISTLPFPSCTARSSCWIIAPKLVNEFFRYLSNFCIHEITDVFFRFEWIFVDQRICVILKFMHVHPQFRPVVQVLLAIFFVTRRLAFK